MDKALARAKRLLVGAIEKIQKEVDLFTSTAEEHGLKLFIDGQLPDTVTVEDEGLLGPYESATKAYIEFMHSTTACGTLFEGLTLIWAMEKVSAPSLGLLILQSCLTKCQVGWMEADKQ